MAALIVLIVFSIKEVSASTIPFAVPVMGKEEYMNRMSFYIGENCKYQIDGWSGGEMISKNDDRICNMIPPIKNKGYSLENTVKLLYNELYNDKEFIVKTNKATNEWGEPVPKRGGVE